MGSRRNGFYDPGLEAVLPAAVPVAREAYAGARRVGGRVWQAQRRFARSQNVSLGFKLLIVLGVWVVGLYIISEWGKSGAKKIMEHFALPTLIGWISPIAITFGMLWGSTTYISDMFKKNPAVTEEAKPELTAFFEENRTYIIVWSIICALIAVYVYYQHRQEQAMYV